MPYFDQDLSQERFSREEVLRLGFELEDYHTLFHYPPIDSPEQRQINLLNQPGSELAREIMLKNVKELDRRLAELPDDTADFDLVLRDIILDIARDSGIHSEEFLNNLYSKETGLFYHLDEASETMVNFANGISQNLRSGHGQLLTERQLDLMDFVARTHDLPKLLGGLNAQIDPDHEVIYRKVIGKYLVGKKFKTNKGGVVREVAFSEKDRDFCADLSGHHEDIYREEQFAGQVESFYRVIDPAIDTDSAVNRARMIFHFIDIFGRSLDFDKKGFLSIQDPENFETRFIDLYRRHINLPIKIPGQEKSRRETNWPRAKADRPQWGLHGVAGLTWTFEALMDGWGIKIDQNLIGDVRLGILQVMVEAMEACDAVIEGKKTEYVLVGSMDELIRKRDNLHTVWKALSKEVNS